MSDSIDQELLDYYQRELTWLRHAGARFAERYPKVARRLELAPGECPDPHVERLLEGFSLLAARLQRRLDDDYAEFSDALLEQLYPLALRPLPSAAVVQFEPDPTKGNLAEGYALPRDTPLFVTTRNGESVHFRTTAEVTLWPLEISDAVLLCAEETQALTGVISQQPGFGPGSAFTSFQANVPQLDAIVDRDKVTPPALVPGRRSARSGTAGSWRTCSAWPP